MTTSSRASEIYFTGAHAARRESAPFAAGNLNRNAYGRRVEPTGRASRWKWAPAIRCCRCARWVSRSSMAAF